MIKKEVFRNYEGIVHMCNGDEQLAVDVSLTLMSPLYDSVTHITSEIVANCIKDIINKKCSQDNSSQESEEYEKSQLLDYIISSIREKKNIKIDGDTILLF